MTSNFDNKFQAYIMFWLTLKVKSLARRLISSGYFPCLCLSVRQRVHFQGHPQRLFPVLSRFITLFLLYWAIYLFIYLFFYFFLVIAPLSPSFTTKLIGLAYAASTHKNMQSHFRIFTIFCSDLGFRPFLGQVHITLRYISLLQAPAYL